MKTTLAALGTRLLPSALWLAPCALLLALFPGRADLLAPDNTLYGLVVLNNTLVTSNDTDLVIEARRADGLPVARYQMGSRPQAGNFYVLGISVEELAPVRNPVAVLTNETLSILVLWNGLVQAQTSYRVAERGQVQRLDFGSLSSAGFEAWARAKGLAAGAGQLDADMDRLSNWQEYAAGTDPLDPASHFAVWVAQTTNGPQISFVAQRAQGPAYEGLNRYYFLDCADNPAATLWTSVAGCSNLLGADQTIVYTLPLTNASSLFYRGRVELRGP